MVVGSYIIQWDVNELFYLINFCNRLTPEQKIHILTVCAKKNTFVELTLKLSTDCNGNLLEVF